MGEDSTTKVQSRGRKTFPLFICLLLIAIIAVPRVARHLSDYFVQNSETLNEIAFDELVANSPDKIQSLEQAWRSGKIPHRQSVVHYLKENSNPTLRTPQTDLILLEAATDGDANVRELALAALSQRKHPMFLQLLAIQLQDSDPNLRLLAIDYIRGEPSDVAMPLLAKMLDDSDRSVAASSGVAMQKFIGRDFGLRVAPVLAEKLEPQTIEDFEKKRSALKKWWDTNQHDYPPAQTGKPTKAAAPFVVSDFVLRDLNGRAVRLSDCRGKTVLLNFWTTWCTACQAEFKTLNELQDRHPSDLIILGISLDGAPDEHGDVAGEHAFENEAASQTDVKKQVARLAALKNLKYRILLDPKNSVGARFNGGELPTNVLIDDRGYFRRRFVGPRGIGVLEAFLSEINRELLPKK